ncbi:MAG: hypothetical protein A3B74_00995 [Candidatus Kerfeldbacteria bacterium RIFCSPHIGHO2_02_FULL_42_14]|uniref:Uncharacterized protein n=1 Tax=Candidatus Kerfeldbacteria bacterium RIFCSPHIGHO2_02_FULL_42_14 TaxID=1798540 RepID=A0A1G2AR68_9BACT|nr:MAG: hypothetical protein A3B74_00995 [Candidatus Kerfeldbacteria bacterium RIFCSPHIGHO2_02_FULL_42_14]
MCPTFPIVHEELVGTKIKISADCFVRGFLYEIHETIPAVRVVEFGAESSIPDIFVYYGVINKPLQYPHYAACGVRDFVNLGEYEVYPNRWYIIATLNNGGHTQLCGIAQPIVSSTDWQWYIDWQLNSENHSIFIAAHTNPGAFWQVVRDECHFGREFEKTVIWWMPEQPN